MAARKIDFQIKAAVLDDLIAIQDKLPIKATGGDGTGDNLHAAQAYDHPAGMALLGGKDDEVDTVIPLKMSGGCWDAPNINYNDMDKGFHALISKDRVCLGMALVRHPKWRTIHDSAEGQMPTHLKAQLHGMRKSFSDITKTAWIVVHNSYFRVYRPTQTKDGRVGCAEIPITSLFSEEDKAAALVMSKMQRDKDLRHALAVELVAKRKAKLELKKAALKAEEEAKKARAAALEAARKAELERIEEAHQAELKKQAKARKKSEEIDRKLKEGKDSIIDAGSGFVYMKQANGEYILWQTKK